MNFLFEERIILLRIFGFLCFCDSTSLKICGAITDILVIRNYTSHCFFRILGSISMKFGQILV